MRAGLLTLLLLAPVLHAADTAPTERESWGQPVPQGAARSIDAALAAFGPGSGSAPTRYHGRIVDVCSKRGCWAMLEANGATARVIPRDHDFMVPRDVRGSAIVYGTLASVDLSAARAKFARENPGQENPIPAQEFRIDATGIELVE